MGLQDIGGGIKTRLETITGLRVYAPNGLPSSLNDLPAALIMLGPTDYNEAFDGDSAFNFRIVIVLAKQDQPSTLDKLLDYIETSGTYSVKAAIEADRTLNGKADTCQLIRNTGLVPVEWGGITYLGTEFELKVWA
jgi:hypothetical protein